MCVAGASIVLGSAYCVRLYQIDARLRQDRAEGLAALDAGDHRTALRRIGLYVQKHPQDVEALYGYARARRLVEQSDGEHVPQAIAALRHLLSKDPNHQGALRELAGLYAQAGYDTEAIAVANRLLAIDPADRDAVRACATSLLRTARRAEAIELLRAHVDRDPFDVDLHVALLELLAQNPSTAAEPASRVARLRELHPDNARVLALESVVRALAGDRNAADFWASRAVRGAELDGATMQILVRQLDSRGEYDAALRLLATAAARENVPSDIARMYGARLFQSGEYLQAVDVLSASAEDASTPNVMGMLAASLIHIDKYEEARAICERLAQLRHNLASVAWAEVLGADPAEIPLRERIRIADKAVSADRHEPFFHLHRGRTYASAGDHETAVECFRSALALAPHWAEPLILASESYEQLGRLEDALAAAGAARQRAPHSRRALVRYAAVAVRLLPADDQEQAANLLNLVSEIRTRWPDDQPSLPILVSLQWRTGDKAAAREALRQALHSSTRWDESTLLQLASLSRIAQVDLEEQFLSLSESLHGQSPDLVFARAMSRFDAGAAQEGLLMIEKAVVSAVAQPQTDSTPWMIAMARYLERMQDPRALETWRTLTAKCSDDARVQWMALSSASVQQDRALVESILQNLASQLGAGGVELRIARAQWILSTAAAERDIVEAAFLLNEATQQAPNAINARVMLAKCLERLGNTTAAVEQLSIAHRGYPDSLAIQLELARLLQSQFDFERAKEHLMHVLQSPLASPAHRRMAAILLARQGEGAAVIAMAADSRNGDSADAQPDLLLAVLYRQQNQIDKAESVLKELLKSPDAAVVMEAARLYASTGRLEKARETLDLLERLDLVDSDRLALRGDFERAHGDASTARGLYEAAVNADVKNLASWHRLIALTLAMGDAPRALEIASAALRVHPGESSLTRLVEHSQSILAIASDPDARPLLVAMLRGAEAEIVSRALQIAGDPGTLPASLLKLADSNPRVLALQSFAARRAIKAERYDDAVRIAARATQMFPAHAEPAQLAATALALQSRWPEVPSAAAQWRRRLGPDTLPADVLEATAHLQLGRPDRAVETLKHCADLSPQQVTQPLQTQAIVMLADSLVRTGRAGNARMLLASRLEHSAVLRKVWRELAVTQITDTVHASVWLHHLSSRIPADALGERHELAMHWLEWASRANYSYGLVLARAYVRHTIADTRRLSAHDVDGLLTAAELAEALHDVALSEEIYREALSLDPRNAQAANNLAMLLLDRPGDGGEALQLAQAAVDAGRGSAELPSYLETLARAQAANGSFAQAISTLVEALTIRPENIEWRVTLARWFADQGALDSARREIEQIDRLLANSHHSPLAADVRNTLEGVRSAVQAERRI